MVRITKDPDERREELMDNAEALFYVNGFEGTSVSEIVKKTKVAQGTFYYYFKTKEDILEAVVARREEALVQKVRDEFSKGSLNAIEKLKVVARVILNHDSQEILFVNQLYQMKYWSLLDALWRKCKEEFIPLLEEICREGHQAGIMKVSYPAETAAILILNIDFLQEALFLRNDEEVLRHKAVLVRDVIVQLLQIPADAFTVEDLIM